MLSVYRRLETNVRHHWNGFAQRILLANKCIFEYTFQKNQLSVF